MQFAYDTIFIIQFILELSLLSLLRCPAVNLRDAGTDAKHEQLL
jgi:hypothetical protein